MSGKAIRIIEDGEYVHLHLDFLPTKAEIRATRNAVINYIAEGRTCFGMIRVEAPDSVRKIAKYCKLEKHFSDGIHECWSTNRRLIDAD